jgi:hypothetical protein
MTQGHGNRTRQSSRKKVVPESEATATGEPADSGDTAEIERRAYEIYLSRNGVPGDPVADWLQAEGELRAAKTAGRS